MIKDVSFYDKESSQYSSKRYPLVASSYVQFFFKERLALSMKELGQYIQGKSRLDLLEVGCADGIVLREIDQSFKISFAHMVGIDTAPDMVKVAALADLSGKTTFFIRGQEPAAQKFDVIVEIGVANYADFDTELLYARDHIKTGGVYILSIAGKGSLNDRLGGGVGYANFLSYQEYEKKIRNVFKIEKTIPVGFRMPFIWRLPVIARMIQAVCEGIFGSIAPNLFHEKIYILYEK